MTSDRILIIGLGLTGCSLGLALRARAERTRVLGHDRDPEAAHAAAELGAIDGVAESLETLEPGIDLVALAIPPGEAAALLPALGPLLPGSAALTDLSPLMLPSLGAASAVPDLRGRFVPGHPLPPEESREGPARADRFRGATVFIGVSIEAGSAAERVAALWASLGAVPTPLAPPLHDALVALTHHLPLVASTALLRTLRRTGSLTQLLAAGASATLRDATRGARPAGRTEGDLLHLNAPKLVPALELLEREVRGLRHAIQSGGPELRVLLEEAGEFRRELVR